MKRHGFSTHNALMDNGEYDIGSPAVQDLLQDKQIQWDVIVMNEHTQGGDNPLIDMVDQIFICSKAKGLACMLTC